MSYQNTEPHSLCTSRSGSHWTSSLSHNCCRQTLQPSCRNRLPRCPQALWYRQTLWHRCLQLSSRPIHWCCFRLEGGWSRCCRCHGRTTPVNLVRICQSNRTGNTQERRRGEVVIVYTLLRLHAYNLTLMVYGFKLSFMHCDTP